MNLANITQIAILILSGVALWLVTSKSKWCRMLSGIVGFLGQGFWVWETWTKGQWGMLILTVWFLYIYLKTGWQGFREIRADYNQTKLSYHDKRICPKCRNGWKEVVTIVRCSNCHQEYPK